MRRIEMKPCLLCTRVPDPELCENKFCEPWKKWFLSRWAKIHAYGRRRMEAPRETAGVSLGGQNHAHPDQVREYLQTDPCQVCACGQELCRTPCRDRAHWVMGCGEVLG